MLELIEIQKKYEDHQLLDGISFQVAQGETICLLGPSGSGKSTLLRIVAGLERPGRGQVCWQGEDLAGLPAHQRGFGMVFQDYALFPHLSVAENVAFGLKMQRYPTADRSGRVAECLQQVHLSGFEQRRVVDLSGGEQQRVALARALAPHPRLLMFDEPLGALDRRLKDSLLEEIRRLLHESTVPAIYVTHDQEEAYAIADRILLLHEGRIIREGTPAEITRAPGTDWAAAFLGLGNVVQATVIGKQRARIPAGVFEFRCSHQHMIGETITLLVRPSAGSITGEAGGISARVTDVIFQKEYYRVALEGGLVFHLVESPRPGERIRLHLNPEAVACLA